MDIDQVVNMHYANVTGRVVVVHAIGNSDSCCHSYYPFYRGRSK